MMSKILVGFAVLVISASVLASTAEFEELDSNSDGYLSAEEAEFVPGLDFDGADTDQDGWLSETEVSKWMDQGQQT